jgi:hypothetical protein
MTLQDKGYTAEREGRKWAAKLNGETIGHGATRTDATMVCLAHSDRAARAAKR